MTLNRNKKKGKKGKNLREKKGNLKKKRNRKKEKKLKGIRCIEGGKDWILSSMKARRNRNSIMIIGSSSPSGKCC